MTEEEEEEVEVMKESGRRSQISRFGRTLKQVSVMKAFTRLRRRCTCCGVRFDRSVLAGSAAVVM